MTTATNIFARCATVQELEFNYEMITSPENISWDGERSAAQIRTAISKAKADYKKRLGELK